jgi:hypothetical protein
VSTASHGKNSTYPDPGTLSRTGMARTQTCTSWYEERTLKTLREEWKNRRNEGMKDREEEEIGRSRDEEM